MKISFLTLLLLLIAPLAAQQTQIAAQVPGTPLHTEFLPFTDHLTVVFIHENAAEIMVLDPGYQPLYERAIPDLGLAPGARFLGVSEEPGTWHLYFLNRGSLVSIQIPRAGDLSTVRLEGFSNANFSGSFSFDGTMHLLRMSAWDNELRLVKFRDGRQVFSETFPLSTPNFVSRANGDFHKMSEEEPQLGDSYYAAKWYRFGDRLVFTLDGDGVTEMVEVDLLSSVVNETSYDWHHTDAPTQHSNSLCLGSYLAYCAWDSDQLQVNIYQMSTQELMLSCAADNLSGAREIFAAPGWSSTRHQMLTESPGSGIFSHMYADSWLEKLRPNDLTSISFIPLDEGWILEAGSLLRIAEYGATGMVVDEQFQKAFISFYLRVPAPESREVAPLVFSSLRHQGKVYAVDWQNRRLQLSRDPNGTIRVW
ncbi:MAG: hypothetical protein NWR72_21450 [Bacteroidia bacterium]|nr:hypothetical protein [Bacteroidia bacterium]